MQTENQTGSIPGTYLKGRRRGQINLFRRRGRTEKTFTFLGAAEGREGRMDCCVLGEAPRGALWVFLVTKTSL